LEDISTIEIGNCILYIIDRDVSLLEDDVFREVAKLFGYTKTSQSMKKIISIALEKLYEKNIVSKNDSGRIQKIG